MWYFKNTLSDTLEEAARARKAARRECGESNKIETQSIDINITKNNMNPTAKYIASISEG